MKKKIITLLKHFLIFAAMLTTIIVGCYGVFYAVTSAVMEVIILVFSITSIGFGLFTLDIITAKLNWNEDK